MVDNVDLTSARYVTPSEAPVTEPEPLTGKEKAGVSLTWGIIIALAIFIVTMLAVFLWGESKFLSVLVQLEEVTDATPEKLKAISEIMSSLESKHQAFRDFWFDTLQLILLNVLFPTLTALLGYVFGTSRNDNSSGEEQV